MHTVASIRFNDDERDALDIVPLWVNLPLDGPLGRAAFDEVVTVGAPVTPDDPRREGEAYVPPLNDPTEWVNLTRKTCNRLQRKGEVVPIELLDDAIVRVTELVALVDLQADPDWWYQHMPGGKFEPGGLFAADPVHVLVESRKVASRRLGTALGLLEAARHLAASVDVASDDEYDQNGERLMKESNR
jgi:hypothetical protein